MTAVNPAAYGFGAPPRVNLMPRAETERRERSVLIGRWLRALLAALAVVAMLAGVTFWLQVSAVMRLAGETTRTETLLSELAALADVRTTLELKSSLTGYRAEAMATDFEWVPILSAVDRVLPAGSTITGFSLMPGGVPVGPDRALEIGVSGTVSVSSATALDIVPLIRSVRPLPGVIEADGWQVDGDDAGFLYELRIALDQSVYTGTYDEAQETR